MRLSPAANSMWNLVFAAVLFLGGMLSAPGVRAELVASPDGQTVYDTEADITWLANANLAAFKTFGVDGVNPDGSMEWTVAQNWVAALNAARYLGSSQWSLPTTQMPDEGCSQKPKSAAL